MIQKTRQFKIIRVCAAAYSFSVFYIFSCFKNTFEYFRQIYIFTVILINKRAGRRHPSVLVAGGAALTPPEGRRPPASGSLRWSEPSVDLRIAMKTKLAANSQSFCLTLLNVETIDVFCHAWLHIL